MKEGPYEESCLKHTKPRASLEEGRLGGTQGGFVMVPPEALNPSTLNANPSPPKT